MQGQYLEPLPPTTTSSTTSIKRANVFAEEDILSPFSMSYATMAGIDLPATSHAQPGSNPQVSFPIASLYLSFPDACYSRELTNDSARLHPSHIATLMIIQDPQLRKDQ